jgi:hypothetical protein
MSCPCRVIVVLVVLFMCHSRGAECTKAPSSPSNGAVHWHRARLTDTRSPIEGLALVNATAHIFDEVVRTFPRGRLVEGLRRGNGEKKREGSMVDPERRMKPAQVSVCDNTLYASIVDRLQPCLEPFLRWSGSDWNDQRSVAFACAERGGPCVSALATLTASEKACLQRTNPVLHAVFQVMCQTSDGQFCGEPYAGLLLFSECSSHSSQNWCLNNAGCEWLTPSFQQPVCQPNYSPTILSRVCTPCLPKIMSALGQASSQSKTAEIATQRGLDMMCVSQGGTYCINYLNQPRFHVDASIFLDYAPALITEICTAPLTYMCYKKYFSLVILWNEAAAVDDYYTCKGNSQMSIADCQSSYWDTMDVRVRQTKILDNLCTNKENATGTPTSTFCMALPHLAREADPNFQDCWSSVFENAQGQATCSESCGTAILPNAIRKWGCCSGAIQDAMKTIVTRAPLPDSIASANSTASLDARNAMYDADYGDPGTGGLMNLATDCSPSFDVSTLDLGWRRCKVTTATAPAFLQLPLIVAWPRISGDTAQDQTIRSQMIRYLSDDLRARFGLRTQGLFNQSLIAGSHIVTLPSLFSDGDQFLGTLFQFSILGQGDIETSVIVGDFRRSLVDKTLTLSLSSSYVQTACIPKGGCTDPGAVSLVAYPSAKNGATAGCRSLLWLVLLVVSMFVVA